MVLEGALNPPPGGNNQTARGPIRLQEWRISGRPPIRHPTNYGENEGMEFAPRIDQRRHLQGIRPRQTHERHPGGRSEGNPEDSVRGPGSV